MSVKTWGDFEIDFERLLGRGGMGAVYMGRQVSLDRPSAIKILKHDLTSNPEFVKRFQREAALLARLVDSHVVQIFGAGEAEGHHFYAMEYVEGEDYASMVRKGRRFSVEEVLKVGEAVGLALQAAWRHRIIHRDIKPSNILLTKTLETKVMDFGLAKNPESDLTQSEVIMGTAKYMSPEQATGGSCDIRSDLYALGVVLYELGTGQPPFIGEGATAIMYQHVHKAPVPPRQIDPAIPPGVEAMILRLMQKDPEARYPTPEALVAAIRGIQEGVTPDERSTLYNETIRVLEKDQVTERRPSTVGTAPVRKPSAVPLVASLAAAVILLGAGGYWLVRSLSGDAPVAERAPAPSPAAPAASASVSDPPAEAPRVPAAAPAVPGAPAASPWEESRKRGLEAFGARQWSMAYTQLEEAERLGAKDVTEKMMRAHANELIDKGEAEGDEEAALRHFEAARKFVDDPDLRALIRSTSFRRYRKSAEKNEGGDWSKAAEEWKRAVEFADSTEAAGAKEHQAFCAKFSEAVTARAGKHWAKALDLYKQLADNPHGQAAIIETEISRIEGELKAAAETAEREARKDFEGLLEQGRQLLRRAVWAEAKMVYERASSPRFAGFPRDEVARSLAEVAQALGAPSGMVYVPAGKFTMGGGRAVESPEGEAETAAFYIDDHEITVKEYSEFLSVLDSFGHTPACPKEEPPNKKHFPLDWDDQKGTDSVVGVDWWDAVSYARWRGKRLPRETEWEKAAGYDPAGRRLYPWGPKYQKEAGKSYLGIDGMGSGVIEWTADWFNKYPWSNAENPDFGERRKVLRGGVLLIEDAAENAKVTFRHWYLPGYRSRKVGIRCAQDVAEK